MIFRGCDVTKRIRYAVLCVVAMLAYPLSYAPLARLIQGSDDSISALPLEARRRLVRETSPWEQAFLPVMMLHDGQHRVAIWLLRWSDLWGVGSFHVYRSNKRIAARLAD